MSSENLKPSPANQIGLNPISLIHESATGPLIKQLVAIAEREEELLLELADAVAHDRTAAIVETARKLVAGHRGQRLGKAENCANSVG